MKALLLSDGDFALVDDADYPELNRYKWSKHNKGYAVRWSKPSHTMMHRVIMKTPAGMVVDHINHDVLDNRRDNLRNVTYSQNGCNTKAHKDNKSGFVGVCPTDDRYSTKPWRAYFRNKNLGYFLTVEEASKAHEAAKAEYMAGA